MVNINLEQAVFWGGVKKKFNTGENGLHFYSLKQTRMRFQLVLYVFV